MNFENRIFEKSNNYLNPDNLNSNKLNLVSNESEKLETFETTNKHELTDKNIRREEYHISKAMRREFNGHGSPIIWLTGLSGSGKSTVAKVLDKKLHDLKIRSYVLDGDNLRFGLNKDLGFSEEDRNENIRRVGEVAKLFSHAGIICICAFISPHQKLRDEIRNLVETEDFIEVHVDCSVEECERRDVKGLYKKARSGEIKNFTGISAPYDIPQNPEIILDTTYENVQESAEKIIQYLKIKQVIL